MDIYIYIAVGLGLVVWCAMTLQEIVNELRAIRYKL